jgi:hypothetical protein
LIFAAPPRAWSRAEREAVFNPDCVDAVFDTPEVAINPVELGQALCVHRRSPRIETAMGHTVTGVDIEHDSVGVVTDNDDESSSIASITSSMHCGRAPGVE